MNWMSPGCEIHVQAQVGAPRLLVEEVERRLLERGRQRHSRFTAPALIWLRM